MKKTKYYVFPASACIDMVESGMYFKKGYFESFHDQIQVAKFFNQTFI